MPSVTSPDDACNECNLEDKTLPGLAPEAQLGESRKEFLKFIISVGRGAGLYSVLSV